MTDQDWQARAMEAAAGWGPYSGHAGLTERFLAFAREFAAAETERLEKALRVPGAGFEECLNIVDRLMDESAAMKSPAPITVTRKALLDVLCRYPGSEGAAICNALRALGITTIGDAQ